MLAKYAIGMTIVLLLLLLIFLLNMIVPAIVRSVLELP